MDILAGQLNVTTGNVYVEGVRVFPSTISKVVSICGQFDTIWPTINVDNAIKIFMRCRGYKKVGLCSSISDPYVKYLINELGMEDMMKKKVKELSGGYVTLYYIDHFHFSSALNELKICLSYPSSQSIFHCPILVKREGLHFWCLYLEIQKLYLLMRQ